MPLPQEPQVIIFQENDPQYSELKSAIRDVSTVTAPYGFDIHTVRDDTIVDHALTQLQQAIFATLRPGSGTSGDLDGMMTQAFGELGRQLPGLRGLDDEHPTKTHWRQKLEDFLAESKQTFENYNLQAKGQSR